MSSVINLGLDDSTNTANNNISSSTNSTVNLGNSVLNSTTGTGAQGKTTTIRLPLDQKVQSTTPNSMLSDEDLNLPGENNNSTNITSTNSIMPATNAITTNSTSTNIADSSLASTNFTPQYNILNNYDQATYHIRWSVISDIPTRTDEVIIAESGATVLNIQELILENSVGPNFRTKNQPYHSFSMRLYEPMGANLYDKLFAAANQLAIQNYQKTPMKLEVSFRGYDPNTGQIAQILGGLIWTWRVTIINCETEITPGGSYHKVTFQLFNETGLNNNHWILPEGISVQGNTLGEILNSVISQLNQRQLEMYGYPFIKYQITDVPYINPPPNSVTRPFLHQTSVSSDLLTSQRNNGTAHIAQGTNIARLIDSLLSNSQTAVQLATTTRNTNAPPDQENDVRSIFHWVTVNTELGNYDSFINDYQKVFKFTIQPYESCRMVANIKNAQEVQDPVYTQKKIQHLINRNFMQKEYDYIFTGNNTEVFKFDINLNFYWSVSASLMLGNQSYAAASVGAQYNQAAQDQLVQQNVLNLKQQLGTLKRGLDSTQNADQQAALQNQITNTQSQITSQQSAFDSALQRRLNNDAQTRQTQEEKLASRPQINTTYIDDDNNSTEQGNIVPMPVSFIQDGDDKKYLVDGIVDGHWDRRRSVYGALLDQLYNQNTDNLAQIELGIRGDPFWLGSQVNGNGFESQETTNITSNLQGPNFSLGEQVFVIKFNIPQGYDETTGLPKLVQDQHYTGFYSTYSVTHKFENGMFTQVLNAVRIPGAQLKDALLNTSSGPTTGNNTVLGPTGTTG